MPEQKIFRIGNSKNPNPEQMEKMVHNLNIKFNCPILIAIEYWSFKNGHFINKIWIDKFDKHFRATNWPDLIKEYRKLMQMEV